VTGSGGKYRVALGGRVTPGAPPPGIPDRASPAVRILYFIGRARRVAEEEAA
jgi:hypothetical protein